MLPPGFELSIPASERLQTHALDRTATGIGLMLHLTVNYLLFPLHRQIRPFSVVSASCNIHVTSSVFSFKSISPSVSLLLLLVYHAVSKTPVLWSRNGGELMD